MYASYDVWSVDFADYDLCKEKGYNIDKVIEVEAGTYEITNFYPVYEDENKNIMTITKVG